MPRPTKKQQTEKDKQDDARARLIGLMRKLALAREQIEGGASPEVILWSIGEAEAVVRQEARIQFEQVAQ